MRILDLGSGVTPKLVSDYTEIEITHADLRLDPPVDMEKLPYSNNSFDMVFCINALDHTKDAEAAVKEMVRVGHYIYINCALDQRTRSGKKHHWDAKPDGRFVNPEGEFSLHEYGFYVECTDGRMIALCLA